ncbi:MAG TPA: ABC transporter ATP-binding protein [Clostridiales bacterium]|nr:ABC transporter ATP-binding protein [Clostridiales bacterium]
MSTILKVENLNKHFGKKQILHDISFETYAGEVFGFLGPNGAGKTTTIKIAVGLLSLDEGDIKINGISVKKDFEGAISYVGGIVENPELYKHMSGMQNLRQYARMRKGVDQKRIDEVVEIVGLKNRINDRVSKYSLGMRQRLGVAQALLHRPKLLVLDEPTNGLDPAGIKGLRDILKDLAHKEQISVLVSSHLMSEMELMCDRIGIIMNGKLIGVKSVEELISSVSGVNITYKLKVDNAEKAVALMDNISDENKKIIDESHIEILVDKENADEIVSGIVNKLVTNGVKLSMLCPAENKKLEDVFMEITKDGGVQIA